MNTPLVCIYEDPRNPTKLLGQCLTFDCKKYEQAGIVRPSLPDQELLLYHQLWRALLRGSEPITQSSGDPEYRGRDGKEDQITRPALPVELVRLIIRTVGFMVPDRQQTQRANRSVFVRVRTRYEEPVVSRVWFWTKPLNMAKTAAAQLVTVSRDQGWVYPKTDISHSFFEWTALSNGSVPAQEEAAAGPRGAVTGNERAWRTENSVQKEGANSASDHKALWRRTHGNPVADDRHQQHNGPRVGMDDEMWKGAKEGSVIVVRVCAQQALWENDARYGEILIWKWFEPVVAVA